MESIALDMDDLFDDRGSRRGNQGDDDDDMGRHAGLPDLDLDEEGVMRPNDNQVEGDY